MIISMNYISVKEAAESWGVSARSVRNYCEQGRVEGAFLTGKTWSIPADTQKPPRLNSRSVKRNILLKRLRKEKDSKIKGGIYHKTQVDLTYNSNHIEGSRLSLEQTRSIFETSTIGIESESINIDDIIETTNHFRAVDYIIDNAHVPLSTRMLKELHRILKSGTSDAEKDWFNVGEFKMLPNEVSGQRTCLPEDVPNEIRSLLLEYNATKSHTFDDIVEFHVRFERIHPFQDGNGRIGRLIMLKECLANNIVPFIIEDEIKSFYYRGLFEWNEERGFLIETCRSAQDRFKASLDYFRIPYE